MQSRKKSRAKKGLAPEALKVRAVKTAGGPPSTTVHAEVKPEKLKETLGGFEKIEEVVAEVPKQQQDDTVRWQETALYKLDEFGAPPQEHIVRYSGTEYGPTDADKYGVRLRVKTGAGVARVEDPDPSRSVRQVDQPRRDPTRH